MVASGWAKALADRLRFGERRLNSLAAAPLRPLGVGSDRAGRCFVAYALGPSPWRLWVVDDKARRRFGTGPGPAGRAGAGPARGRRGPRRSRGAPPGAGCGCKWPVGGGACGPLRLPRLSGGTVVCTPGWWLVGCWLAHHLHIQLVSEMYATTCGHTRSIPAKFPVVMSPLWFILVHGGSRGQLRVSVKLLQCSVRSQETWTTKPPWQCILQPASG
jgi:hypothetical protein